VRRLNGSSLPLPLPDSTYLQQLQIVRGSSLTILVGPTPSTVTDAANYGVLGIDAGICRRVFVAVLAMRRASSDGVVATRASTATLITAFLILRVCYGLNMLWITAVTVITNMVRFKPGRHRPVEILPNKPIRRDS
jgi:hypothetical protein